MAMTFIGPIPIKVKVLEQHRYINGNEVKLLGSIGEVSLLYSKEELNPFPFEIGNSDELKINDKIFIVGSPFLRGFTFKNGIISSLSANKWMDNPYVPYLKCTKDDMFITTAPINPGDSGSPALKIDSDGLKLVGIANAGTNAKGMGFCLKINYMMKRVEEIKNM